MQRHRDKSGTPVAARSDFQPVGIRTPANSLHPGPLEHSETHSIVKSLGLILQQRDPHTAAHSERLAFTGVAVGVAMQLDAHSLQTLYVGGVLHDIGKVGIADSILFKPDKLDSEEWHTIRAHPVLGEEICRPIAGLRAALPLIRHHHERWDGSGYPDGLRGHEIPLLARIIQVVDIYDALTNPRSYREASSCAGALEILCEETDRGWRDPELTALFLGKHRKILSGSVQYREFAESAQESMEASMENLHAYLAV